jgi:hypothetical protein
LFPPRPPLSAQQPTFIVARRARSNQPVLWPEIFGLSGQPKRALSLDDVCS